MSKKGRFKKGTSGNPRGRREGSKNKATLLLQAMGEDAAVGILARVLRLAKTGDLQAAKLVLDRVWPVTRSKKLEGDMKPIQSIGDALAAGNAVLSALAGGEMSPEQSTAMLSLIGLNAKILETKILEDRVKALEEGQSHASQ